MGGREGEKREGKEGSGGERREGSSSPRFLRPPGSRPWAPGWGRAPCPGHHHQLSRCLGGRLGPAGWSTVNASASVSLALCFASCSRRFWGRKQADGTSNLVAGLPKIIPLRPSPGLSRGAALAPRGRLVPFLCSHRTKRGAWARGTGTEARGATGPLRARSRVGPEPHTPPRAARLRAGLPGGQRARVLGCPPVSPLPSPACPPGATDTAGAR